MIYFTARLSPTFLGVPNMGLGDNPAGTEQIGPNK
jgi:hypothetical protein